MSRRLDDHPLRSFEHTSPAPDASDWSTVLLRREEVDAVRSALAYAHGLLEVLGGDRDYGKIATKSCLEIRAALAIVQRASHR